MMLSFERMNHIHRGVWIPMFLTLLLIAAPASAEVRDIVFPTQTTTTFSDDFGDPRPGGRTHEGVDILGQKMMQLYAAVDGIISYLTIPEASWGYEISIEDTDHYRYNYLHVNNDTPGTDDGMGGVANAFAPGIAVGVHVTRGEFIGWMGDSGDAEAVTPHLHFEIRLPDDTAIDPYPSLIAARYVGTYSASEAKAASPTINFDKMILPPKGIVNCVSGARIKSKTSSSVYYCVADGSRYVFPNDKVYFSWYPDFTGITTLSADQLASIPLGKNVTYRPGVKMVKIVSMPQVYVVTQGGVLHWVTSTSIAASIFGSNWAKNVDDIPDTFFTDYTVGSPITASR